MLVDYKRFFVFKIWMVCFFNTHKSLRSEHQFCWPCCSYIPLLVHILAEVWYIRLVFEKLGLLLLLFLWASCCTLETGARIDPCDRSDIQANKITLALPFI